MMPRDPVVLEARFASLRLCVPGGWTDLQVLEFAEDEHACGALSGWRIRGERVACLDGDGMAHVVVGI